jgi:small subunit ribosomal protein S1
MDGFDTQRNEWEGRYAEAERRHKMHTAQMEKFAAAEAAGHGDSEQPAANGASSQKEAGGSLASDAQLAALREKLAGNA